MSLELWQRLKSLERRVSELEKKPAGQVVDVTAEVKAEEKAVGKMCPKCGEKPAYFFHVRSCRGPK